MEQLRSTAGIKLTHVPFKGGGAAMQATAILKDKIKAIATKTFPALRMPTTGLSGSTDSGASLGDILGEALKARNEKN